MHKEERVVRDRADGKQGSQFWITLPIVSKKIGRLKEFCNIYVIKVKDLLANILLNSMIV